MRTGGVSSRRCWRRPSRRGVLAVRHGPIGLARRVLDRAACARGDRRGRSHEALFEAPTARSSSAIRIGSFATRIVAQRQGERFGGVVLVDGALAARENDDEFDGVPARGHRHRMYPTLEQAMARFRFEPAQTCDNPCIVDFIARTSLGPVTGRRRRGGLVVALRSRPARQDDGVAHRRSCSRPCRAARR